MHKRRCVSAHIITSQMFAFLFVELSVPSIVMDSSRASSHCIVCYHQTQTRQRTSATQKENFLMIFYCRGESRVEVNSISLQQNSRDPFGSSITFLHSLFSSKSKQITSEHMAGDRFITLDSLCFTSFTNRLEKVFIFLRRFRFGFFSDESIGKCWKASRFHATLQII